MFVTNLNFSWLFVQNPALADNELAEAGFNTYRAAAAIAMKRAYCTRFQPLLEQSDAHSSGCPAFRSIRVPTLVPTSLVTAARVAAARPLDTLHRRAQPHNVYVFHYVLVKWYDCVRSHDVMNVTASHFFFCIRITTHFSALCKIKTTRNIRCLLARRNPHTNSEMMRSNFP
jgi:hypothetical protein